MTLTDERTQWRRLFWWCFWICVVGYVLGQIPWQEWYDWTARNWPIVRGAAILWVLSGIFHVTLTVFVLAIIRSGHEADERAERNLNRVARYKSRVDRLTGRETEK